LSSEVHNLLYHGLFGSANFMIIFAVQQVRNFMQSVTVLLSLLAFVLIVLKWP